MFIKNMAAFHSEPGGRRMQKKKKREEKERMFVLNKQRQVEFVYAQI